jgi:hypothetical protein
MTGSSRIDGGGRLPDWQMWRVVGLMEMTGYRIEKT